MHLKAVQVFLKVRRQYLIALGTFWRICLDFKAAWKHGNLD